MQRHTPEDAAQTAFTRYAALEHPEAVENPRAFLFRSARNHPNHDSFFCPTDYLAEQMADVFEKLRALPFSTDTPERFAAAIAAPIVQLNAIHPFREGNGRAMRLLIDQLARANGLVFDQTRLDADQWNDASRDSFLTDNAEPMRTVVLSALSAPSSSIIGTS